MSQSSLRYRTFLAIFLMVAGVLLSSTGSALIKLTSNTYPISQILLFRMLIGLFPIILFSQIIQKQSFYRTRHLKFQLIRGLIGFFAMGCFFISLKILPLAEGVALILAGTIFIPVLTFIFLKEKINRKYWLAILFGFAGVLLITRPGADIFNPVSLIALTSAILFAVSITMIRYLGKHDNLGSTTFYFTFVCLVGAGLTIPWEWWQPESFLVRQNIIGWQALPFRDLGVICLIGLIGGIAQLMMTQAFRLTSPVILAPFDYMEIVFSGMLGYFFWQEIPDYYLVGGAGIIISSGLYIIYQEHKIHAK